MYIKFSLWRWSAWIMAMVTSFATPLSGAAAPTSAIRNIVLVHGAFADGSSWLPVIKILHSKGYHVTAVQNPLTSLADDVAATRRVLERQKGGVILVGHSWAGAVVTEAGNADNVQGLVYLSALVPDAGESVGEMLNRLASPMEGLAPDKEGLIWLDDPVAYRQVMAGDVPVPTARLLAATQQPISARTFVDKVTTAAWQKKPSWYLMTENDRALPPRVQQALAQHIGATTMTVNSSHMSLVSHPEVVASLIERAARSLGK
ncbi:alpha/beta hydrolase [Undibacterium sp. YM2]|uniref:alpha/beta fold hydrolase n=1 Tax=Undibacterium sp. YM2 TaxID=2058625 RepID=UPI001331D53F|nr:alpha/beta hydrolase [Undibacterium sp. YM2]BBB66043.1 alpha/beta hydrolase [Undibacterium sp. YM2]